MTCPSAPCPSVPTLLQPAGSAITAVSGPAHHGASAQRRSPSRRGTGLSGAAGLLALLAGVVGLLVAPGDASADGVRFRTPGLAPSAIELPAHDSVLLVATGWSPDRVEAAIVRAWKDPEARGPEVEPLGLRWTGPDERPIVSDAATAGKAPLRVEVAVAEPIARDSWGSKSKKKAQYGPVTVKGAYYQLTRTVELRADIMVYGPAGETVHAASAAVEATEKGAWEAKEADAAAHANSAETMAGGLIDELAAKLGAGLMVQVKPRTFVLEKDSACTKEIAGCPEAFDLLKKSDDLKGAYAAMTALQGGDAWIHFNSAVLAAALRNYEAARGHLDEAKKLGEEKRFDALLKDIKDWEAEDQKLLEAGYPLAPPT